MRAHPLDWRKLDRPRGLAADRQGAAAVEFALILPMLVLLLAGLIDGSRLISTSMQLHAAAQAGADYARANGWNASAIQGAVTAATPMTGVTAPPPQLTTACVVNGALATPPGSGPCASGGTPGSFVTVTAQKPFKALAPWPGLSPPATLSATAMVRIQ